MHGIIAGKPAGGLDPVADGSVSLRAACGLSLTISRGAPVTAATALMAGPSAGFQLLGDQSIHEAMAKQKHGAFAAKGLQPLRCRFGPCPGHGG